MADPFRPVDSRTGEQLYSLAEAKKELAFRQCQEDGHDLRVEVAFGSQDPKLIHCARCGASWEIAGLV